MSTSSQKPKFPVNQKILLRVVIGIYLIAFIAAASKYSPTFFDDAYMFIRYAKNFWQGSGFSWNIEDGPIYGSTSFLYLLMVTLFYKILPISDSAILQSLSCVMGILYIGLLIRMARLFTSLGKNQYQHLLISGLIILLLGRGFFYHCFTGMDTTTSMLTNALLIFCVLCYKKKPTRQNLILVAFSAFLTLIARPDNFFYALIFPGLFLLLDSTIKSRGKQFLYFYSVLAVLIGIKFLFDYTYFGDWLPLSYYVKQNDFYQGYTDYHLWNPVKYLVNIVSVALPFILLIIFSMSNDTWKMVLSFILPLLLTWIYFFSTLQIMGMEARFYYPSLPFLIVPALMSIDQLAKSTNLQRLKTRIFSPLKLISVFLIFLVISHQSSIISQYKKLLVKDKVEYDSPIRKGPSHNSLVNQNEWFEDIQYTALIAQRVPKGAIVAATEIGLLSSSAPHVRIVDMTGLQNRHLAHSGFYAYKVLNEKPDLIFMHKGYSKMNFDLFSSHKFITEYEVYVNVFYGGFAIRKEAKYYNELMSVISDVWKQAYPNKAMADWEYDLLTHPAL